MKNHSIEMVRLDGYSQPKEIGSLIVNGQGGDMAYSTQNTSCDSEDPKEGANKRGNSSRLTQSFHFFMFEPIFSPVNASNQPI